MSIRLEKPYSKDGLGVKLWRYVAGKDSHELSVYDRPKDYIENAALRFMLRLEKKSGEHVLTVYTPDKDSAAKLANLICNGL